MKKRLKIRKISLSDVFDLYKILEDYFPEDKYEEDKFLAEILNNIIKNPSHEFYLAMKILTGLESKQLVKHEELEAVGYFIQGLKENEFFEFSLFMRELKNGR